MGSRSIAVSRARWEAAGRAASRHEDTVLPMITVGLPESAVGYIDDARWWFGCP